MLRNIASWLFLACVLTVSAADASPLKARHPKTVISGGGGGSVDATLVVRPTQTRVVDLTTALSGCTSTELIAATYTGPVKMMLSPAEGFEYGVATTTRQLRKRELTDFTTADTSSASTGSQASVWTFTCAAGTYKIGFDVAEPEINAWNYGADTFARRGGFPLYYLPGNASDWSITSGQNPSSGFEIWNGRLVWACASNTTQCPTEASNPAWETASGATKVIASPTGTYNVGLTNSTLGITRTIVITAIAHQRDVAPTSTHLTSANAGGGQLCDAIAQTSPGNNGQAKQWGDKIVLEGSKEFPQTYDYGSSASTFCNDFSIYTVGSVAKPSLPYDPGFVQVTPREPWQAKINNFKLDMRGIVCTPTCATKDAGLRLTALDTFSLGGDGFVFQDFGANPQYLSLIQMDHNKIGSQRMGQSGATANYRLFATDNYSDGSLNGGTLAVYSYDCKIDGNWLTNITQDGIDQGCVDSTATHVASLSWNTIVNLHTPFDCGHPDFIQAFYNTQFWLPTTPGDYRGPTEAGNLMVHGIIPTITLGNVMNPGCLSLMMTDVGNENIDGEGILQSDVGGLGELGYRTERVGNLLVGSYSNGMTDLWQASFTQLRHNQIMFPTYVTAAAGLNRSFISQAGVPVILWQGIGAKMQVQDNVGVIVAPGTFGFAAVASFPSSGANNYATSGLSDTDLNDPYNTDFTSKRAIIDHFRPKAGSALETAGAGPFYDITKIDHRGRVLDSSLTTPDASLIQRPTCNTTEVVTKGWAGTFPVAGNTASVTTSATFNGSPTSFEDRWMVTASDTLGQVFKSAGTTYTVVSGDLSRPSAVLWHLMVGINAGGKGQCTTSGLALS